jgi:hypothetical protein
LLRGGAGLHAFEQCLKIIDRKIDVYRGRLAAGDADQLWAPNRLVRVPAD